jgi:hypothetical protein
MVLSTLDKRGRPCSCNVLRQEPLKPNGISAFSGAHRELLGWTPETGAVPDEPIGGRPSAALTVAEPGPANMEPEVIVGISALVGLAGLLGFGAGYWQAYRWYFPTEKRRWPAFAFDGQEVEGHQHKALHNTRHGWFCPCGHFLGPDPRHNPL